MVTHRVTNFVDLLFCLKYYDLLHFPKPLGKLNVTPFQLYQIDKKIHVKKVRKQSLISIWSRQETAVQRQDQLKDPILSNSILSKNHQVLLLILTNKSSSEFARLVPYGDRVQSVHEDKRNKQQQNKNNNKKKNNNKLPGRVNDTIARKLLQNQSPELVIFSVKILSSHDFSITENNTQRNSSF